MATTTCNNIGLIHSGTFFERQRQLLMPLILPFQGSFLLSSPSIMPFSSSRMSPHRLLPFITHPPFLSPQLLSSCTFITKNVTKTPVNTASKLCICTHNTIKRGVNHPSQIHWSSCYHYGRAAYYTTKY